MKPARQDLEAFFKGSIWEYLLEEWRTWAFDIMTELKRPENSRDLDCVLKGNIQLLERVIATPHYLMQDFESTDERKEEKDGEAD
jgi:hypothetical protein